MDFISMIPHMGLFLLSVTVVQAAPIAQPNLTVDGTFTKEKIPDAATQALADSALVRSQVEQKIKRDRFSQYKVVSVKSQVVAGTNYKMKIQIGPNEYIHVRVFEPFKQFQMGPKVALVQGNKKRNDPL